MRPVPPLEHELLGRMIEGPDPKRVRLLFNLGRGTRSPVYRIEDFSLLQARSNSTRKETVNG